LIALIGYIPHPLVISLSSGLRIMKFMSTVAALLGLAVYSVRGASTFSPARPPAVPLAVRAPYLNTWLEAGSDGGNGGYLAGEWATFWEYVIWSSVHDFVSNSTNLVNV
jgi:hypothetical protein